jgi:hypothetical protein
VLSYGQECAQQAYDERKQIKISNLRDQPWSLPRNENRVGSVVDTDSAFQVNLDTNPVRGPEFTKNTAENFFIIKNCIDFSLGLHKGCTVQATEEAFSPQKRTFKT